MRNELKHYGILGMKWGKRKKVDYESTSFAAARARRANQKVDAGFDEWKKNAKLKETAIDLGKKATLARMEYERNKSDKNLKKAYKTADKEYRRALRKNTAYRKGDIRQEVGADLSRKYLSEAKKVKKLLNKDPNNKDLKKQYNDLMSKHDIERAKARRAAEVGHNRSQAIANMKRAATMTVKAVAIGTAVGVGIHFVNKFLKSRKVTINGKEAKVTTDNVTSAFNAVNTGKNIFSKIKSFIY